MTLPADTRQLPSLIERDVRGRRDLTDLWRSLVSTDSGSNDHDGVARVGELVKARLERIWFTAQPVRPSER